MRVKLTSKGYELAKTEYKDGMTVLTVDDPPTVMLGIWSFANDVLQFLNFWRPEKEYRSFHSLCLAIHQALIEHNYGCDAFAVQNALTSLVSKGYAVLLHGTETVETDEVVHLLSVLANPDRLVILRRLLKERLTGSRLALELEGSQPRMSEYLRMLERAGFVSHTRESKYVYFTADSEAVMQMIATLFAYFFEEREVTNAVGSSHIRRQVIQKLQAPVELCESTETQPGAESAS